MSATVSALRQRVVALQTAPLAAWWYQRTRWAVDRPWPVIAILGATGLLIRHAWLTTVPLASGDWHWSDRPRVLDNFPWPSVWDTSWGLGGENRFLSAFRYPVQALEGLIAQMGADWSIIEKVLFFIPFAILLPVAGWLLAREIMGRTRWTLLTPVLLLGSTYFMTESDGEIPLTLAEAISFLTLVAFLRTMRRRTVGWAVITGLLAAATTTFDIRATYLSVVLMGMYFVINAVADRDWRVLRTQALLGVVAGAVLAGSQLFWLVPLVTYHGNAGLPLAQAPNFTILTLGHGLAGVSTSWTGGQLARFVQAPLNPVYMIFPLIALAPLLARRLSREVVWLALVALCFAFFAKTNNPPLGGLYDWMFQHVPGWKLFREGSKFLYPVGIAYALLIPIAIRMGFEWRAARPAQLRQLFVRGAAAVALAAVVVVSCFSVGVLQTGALGSTTQPTSEPASFSQFSNILAADTRPGPVLWVGRPVVSSGNNQHHFIVGSPLHPPVNLTGAFAAPKINQRDPFQQFCADSQAPYCYLDQQLFPYLLRLSGAGYVVVPSGSDEGALPRGITRSWLRRQMTSILGTPSAVGHGDTAILVWRVVSPAPVVTTSPAVAVVDSGSWATTGALPALQALGLPVAYRASFNNHLYPAAPRGVPDSVRVLPRVGGGCTGTEQGAVAVLAQDAGSSLTVTTAASGERTLPRLVAATRAPGWAAYGPLSLPAGGQLIAASEASGAVLGPCVTWSALAERLLSSGTGSTPVGPVVAAGEQVKAGGSAGQARWVELRRYYDPGWLLSGHRPTMLGDGLFNLYHAPSTGLSAAKKLTFTYSTERWERIGDALAAIAVVVAVAVAVRDFRRRRFPAGAEEPARALQPPLRASTAARLVSAAGLALVAVSALATTLEWFGAPSNVPGIGVYADDPYDLDVGFGAVAVGVLILALAVRLASHWLRTGGASEEASRAPRSRRLEMAAATFILPVLLLAGCAGAGRDIQGLLSEAQQAGAVAPTIEGSSLDDARLRRAASQPALCIADYTEAMQDFPNLLLAYTGRGDCYLNGGKNGPAAVHDYTRALSLSRDSADVLLRRAVADRASGNRAAAIADYRRAVALPSSTPRQQLVAVDGLVVIEAYDEARDLAAQSLVRFPRSFAPRVAAADIAIATDDDELADEELAAAQQLASSRSERAVVLGRVCNADVLRHEYLKATVDCANVTSLTDNGSGAYDNLAVTELALGDPSAALVDIDASIDSFVANVGTYAQAEGVDGFGLARLYEARGFIDLQLYQPRAALADFERATQSLPGPAPDARARLKGDIATARAAL